MIAGLILDLPPSYPCKQKALRPQPDFAMIADLSMRP